MGGLHCEARCSGPDPCWLTGGIAKSIQRDGKSPSSRLSESQKRPVPEKDRLVKNGGKNTKVQEEPGSTKCIKVSLSHELRGVRPQAHVPTERYCFQLM